MSSPAIKNVTVVGASGTIGAPILTALLANSAFNVSVLSRLESAATFPSGVEVKKAQLDSHSSLVRVLKGQDAVICTLNDLAVGAQFQLIEAAFEAGVRRFIPSEWGCSDIKFSVAEIEENISQKLQIIELLNSKAREAERAGREFHWTAVNCGVFFDWGLRSSFLEIALPPTKTATLWDQGTNVFSATNLSAVAAAVVALLTFAESKTRDRFIYVESLATSQVEMVSALEKATGEPWTIERTTTEEQFAAAQMYLAEGNIVGAFYRWIRGGLFSGVEGCRFEEGKLDNELLGIKKESLDDVVAKILRGEAI